MHSYPELKALQEKYKDNPYVAFVGVHTAKFAAEQDGRSLSRAIIKYNITHPVISDADRSMWKNLSVTAWPTIVVVGATGNVILNVSVTCVG